MKTKYLYLILLISIFTTSGVNAQSIYDSPKFKQGAAKFALNNSLEKYFGGPGSTIYNQVFFTDKETQHIYFSSHYKIDKYTSSGETFYDTEFKIQFAFKDVEDAYIVGDKIHFKFNSNNYLFNSKFSRSKWTGYRKAKNDYLSLTINNDEKIKDILKRLKTLIKYPKILKEFEKVMSF